MKRMSTGRPRTARTPENVESVRRSVIGSPRRSTRRRASVLGLSRRSLQRILHGELNFHPYKIVIFQKLLPSDFVQRRPFCVLLAAKGQKYTRTVLCDTERYNVRSVVSDGR
jgi:hypothetical protein